MSKPNFTIQVEPLDSGNATYLRLAPTTVDGAAVSKIVLRLQVKNNEASHVTVTGITFSFPGSVHLDADMKDVNSYGNLDIAAGDTIYWSNGVSANDNSINNAVYLTGPAPSQVKVSLTCDNYSEPATITLSLVPHKSPVAGDAYRFPFDFNDLRTDEYMYTSAKHWANGGVRGTQIFAHDISCVGWDKVDMKWSELLHDGDKKKNKDYRIWDKSVCAMANGTVESWLDTMAENTIVTDANGKLKFPTLPASADNRGNHIVIRHGTEMATYCHFQNGSIPAALQSKGATVTEGQELGRVGNTGNATNPHTHIECVAFSGHALRPLPFRDGWVVDKAQLAPPGAKGPWFRLRGHGISQEKVAIWPLGRNPQWRGWQDLGGTIKAPPAVASWDAHRLDVFSAGTDGKLVHKWWDGTNWHNWQPLGGVFKDGPAAVSWGPHRIDVFVRGMDNHLGHLWWNGSEWKGWEDLGGNLTSAPAVASWDANRLDVFAAGADGKLKHKWWDGAKWHDWENLGGTFKGAPAVVSWGPKRIDVFVRGMDDHLGHLWWNGSEWKGWEDLGGPILSAPAVASWSAHRLDVLAAGPDGQLQHKWWDGSTWSDWDWIGGNFQGNPAAVSWGTDRLDVFVQGMDNHLGHLWHT